MTIISEKIPRPWGHVMALAILLLLCALPSLYHGIARDALANSDMDLVSVYQALLINSNQPLVHNAHTGFGYFLSLAGWFNALHFFGVLPVNDMDSLMASKNFDAAYLSLVVAGRWFAIFQAWVFIGLVNFSIYSFLKEYEWGIWATFILSIALVIGGGGIPSQSFMLRTELLSMILIYASAMALIAAPNVTITRSYWLLGLTGLLIHLALMVKIQNIIVILFLPLLPLVFGKWKRKDFSILKKQKMNWAIPIIAVILITPITILFIDNIAPDSHIYFHGLILIYIAICAFIYSYLNLGAVRYGIVGLSAIAIGFVLSFGLFLFHKDWWTFYAIVNFLDHLLIYSPASTVLPNKATEFTVVLQSIIKMAPTIEIFRFFDERFRNLDYPFMVFYILVPAAIFLLALKKNWEVAIKAGFLCLMAGLIVGIFWIGRGFFNFYYSIYVEVWIILALAIVLKYLHKISNFQNPRWIFLGSSVFFILIASVIIFNVRNRLLEPSTANPVVAYSTCFIRGLTPLFYTKFNNYCGSTWAKPLNFRR